MWRSSNGDLVAADLHPRLHKAAACCDVEVPFVPGAADGGRLRLLLRVPVAQRDAADGAAAAAQWCTAVRAAVGECMEGFPDTDDTDTVAAEVEHADLTRGRRIVERDPGGGHGVGAGTGRPKKRMAFPCATASRYSAGKRLSVWRGSSKSQCG